MKPRLMPLKRLSPSLSRRLKSQLKLLPLKPKNLVIKLLQPQKELPRKRMRLKPNLKMPKKKLKVLKKKLRRKRKKRRRRSE